MSPANYLAQLSDEGPDQPSNTDKSLPKNLTGSLRPEKVLIALAEPLRKALRRQNEGRQPEGSGAARHYSNHQVIVQVIKQSFFAPWSRSAGAHLSQLTHKKIQICSRRTENWLKVQTAVWSLN